MKLYDLSGLNMQSYGGKKKVYDFQDMNGFRRHLSNWFYKGKKIFWSPARHSEIQKFAGVRKDTKKIFFFLKQ